MSLECSSMLEARRHLPFCRQKWSHEGPHQEAILGGSAEHWQASLQQSWLDSGLKNHTSHVNLYKFHLFNSRCSLDSCLLETIVKAMDSFDVSCLVSVFISKCYQSLEVESRSVVWAGLVSAVPECCYYNHEPLHPAWILLHCSQPLTQWFLVSAGPWQDWKAQDLHSGCTEGLTCPFVRKVSTAWKQPDKIVSCNQRNKASSAFGLASAHTEWVSALGFMHRLKGGTCTRQDLYMHKNNLITPNMLLK